MDLNIHEIYTLHCNLSRVLASLVGPKLHLPRQQAAMYNATSHFLSMSNSARIMTAQPGLRGQAVLCVKAIIMKSSVLTAMKHSTAGGMPTEASYPMCVIILRSFFMLAGLSPTPLAASMANWPLLLLHSFAHCPHTSHLYQHPPSPPPFFLSFPFLLSSSMFRSLCRSVPPELATGKLLPVGGFGLG